MEKDRILYPAFLLILGGLIFNLWTPMPNDSNPHTFINAKLMNEVKSLSDSVTALELKLDRLKTTTASHKPPSCRDIISEVIAETQILTNPKTISLDLSADNLFGGPPQGFGSLLNHYGIPALIIAAGSGKRLTFTKGRVWHYGCPGKQYVSDILKLSPSVNSSDEEVLDFRTLHDNGNGFAKQHKNKNRLYLAWRHLEHEVYTRSSRTCTKEIDMLSAAAKHLVVASSNVATFVRKHTMQLRLPNLYNAVHIRGGDKLLEESADLKDMTSSSRWWSRFIEESFEFHHDQTSEKVPIFIASDSCSILLAVKLELVNRGFQVFHSCNIAEPEASNDTGHDASTWSKGHTCESVYSLLSEIQILANAQQFAGSLRSNLPRLVVKLRGTLSTFSAVPNTKWVPF